jgi:hypothetical protein
VTDLVKCASQVCSKRIEAPRAPRGEKRQYCNKDCRMDVWAIRRVRKLLADKSDREVLDILRANERGGHAK